jgi:hypothetical protein
MLIGSCAGILTDRLKLNAFVITAMFDCRSTILFALAELTSVEFFSNENLDGSGQPGDKNS